MTRSPASRRPSALALSTATLDLVPGPNATTWYVTHRPTGRVVATGTRAALTDYLRHAAPEGKPTR